MPLDLSQVNVAWLVTVFIELLKRSDHPWLQWIDQQKKGVCRAVSVLGAVASGLGFTFSGSLWEGGTLIVPPLMVLLNNLLGAQLLQEVIYQNGTKKMFE